MCGDKKHDDKNYRRESVGRVLSFIYKTKPIRIILTKTWSLAYSPKIIAQRGFSKSNFINNELHFNDHLFDFTTI